MVTATDRLGSYAEVFGSRPGTSAPAWLERLRRDSFDRFLEMGFPTRRDEDWRFTNVSWIANTHFRGASVDPDSISCEEVAAYRLAGAACHLVFVDGRYAPHLSLVTEVKGLEAGSLTAGIATDPEGAQRHFGRYAGSSLDAFGELNTALFEDGAYVRIERGAIIDAPIYLLYVSTSNDGNDGLDVMPVMSHPRNLIVAGPASHASVIERYVSLGTGAAFTNAITEIVAGDAAVLSHYMVECDNRESSNVSTLIIEQGRGSNVSSHSILIGGRLVRNNVHPILNGEGAECLINGLFLGGGRQHLDNHMVVEHAKPHCASRQFYNGILDGAAHGVFHGRIIVHKDAQKTDAKQTNRNLLLSADARIDTKPQLEIYADDVKCTHGATIGQIDETALFYLRARGIGEAEARKMLLYAFASECLDRMQAPSAREMIGGLIREALSEIGRSTAAGVASDGQSVPQEWKEIG